VERESRWVITEDTGSGHSWWIGSGSPAAHPLVLVGVFEPEVVGDGSHGDGQLADLLQLDGPLMGSHDERIHPPIRRLRIFTGFIHMLTNGFP